MADSQRIAGGRATDTVDEPRRDKTRVLVIDDDDDFVHLLKRLLAHHGRRIESTPHPREGMEKISDDAVDVVLLDNRMPGMDGIELLQVLSRKRETVPVIFMTQYLTSELVIEATNLGAFDCIEKSLDMADFAADVESCIRRAERFVLRQSAACEAPSSMGQGLLGNSKPMVELYKQIGEFAKTDLPVMVRGETGCGKELVTQAIHQHSARKDKPFVALNCSALNPNLLDDELFGHVPGAFSGGEKLRKGRFEYAHTGTLFLDEVGDMPIDLQAKLLRVLESREVIRIGSNEPIRVDVRLISATHQNLESLVAEGRFRADLMFRLNGVTLTVPPLRDRQDDVGLLARRFLAEEAAKTNRPAPGLAEETMALLAEHSWPGNVRELQFVIRRAVQKCRGPDLLPEHLELADPTQVGALDRSTEELSRLIAATWQSREGNVRDALTDALDSRLIEFALAACDGNRTRAAERLGISRNFLNKRIKQLGLDTRRSSDERPAHGESALAARP